MRLPINSREKNPNGMLVVSCRSTRCRQVSYLLLLGGELQFQGRPGYNVNSLLHVRSLLDLISQLERLFGGSQLIFQMIHFLLGQCCPLWKNRSIKQFEMICARNRMGRHKWYLQKMIRRGVSVFRRMEVKASNKDRCGG